MHGQLTARSATDICHELAEASATGVLFLTGRQASGRLVFDRGQLVAASSPTPSSRLGARLVNGGWLDEDALNRVLEEQQGTPDADRPRLGQLLVDRGLVPLEAVRRVIQDQLLDAVFDLASWGHGSYTFDTDAVLETPEVPLAISIDQALVEVARRRDEWAALSEVITDLDAIPHFRPGANTATAALEPDEFAVMASVDGSRSIRDLADDLGYGEFEAARIVYALNLVGLVDVAPPVDEIGAALDDALSFGGYDESAHPAPDASANGTPTGSAPERAEAGAATDPPPWADEQTAQEEAHGRAPAAGGPVPQDGDPAPPEEAGAPVAGDARDAAAADADDPFDSSIFDEFWAAPDAAGAPAADDEPEPWSSIAEAGALPAAAPPGAEKPDAAEPDAEGPDAEGPDAEGPATRQPEVSPRAADQDTTLEADLPRPSGFDELRQADRRVVEAPSQPPHVDPDPAATEAPRQRAPRSPSPGAGGDVSEFLRELSRLALDEEIEEPPGESEPPAPSRESGPRRPAPAPPRDEGRKKKRGLFGFGN